MRGVAFVALLTVVLAALSGCLSKDAKTDSADPTSSSTSTSSAPANNTTAKPNHLPVANLTVPANVTVGLNATFLLNATDADGDALTWVLSFGDNTSANGTFAAGPVANATHAYNATGLYNLTLVVKDGHGNATVTSNVTVLAGGPDLPTTTLHVDDAPGDGSTPTTELVWFEARIDGAGAEAALVMVLQVDTLYPTTAALTPVSYSVAINGHQFDSFARYPIDGNPMTWDGAAYMAGGTSSWDTDANQVTFTFPLALLEESYKLSYPFQLHALTNFGGLLQTFPDDLAPDAGDVPF